MNFQSKFLKTVEGYAEESGLDFVHNSTWANIGKVFLQRRNSFDTLFSFTYDFQDDTFTVQVYPSGVVPVLTCGGTDKNCIGDFYCYYADNKKVQSTLEFLKSQMGKKRGKKNV